MENQTDFSGADESYKFVLVGESNVGKTSLVLRFVRDTFNQHEEPTLGAAFLSKFFSPGDGRKIKLDIWDTAGQERFRAIVPMYYRDASVAIVCYDITKYESFQKAKDWIKEIRSNLVQQGVVVVLVGNKLDLESDRKVEKGEAKSIANDKGVLFFECSAKNGNNVNDTFKTIVSKLPKQGEEQKNGKKGLEPKPEENKGGCCK